MAMSLGKAEINVTPLIHVLLVLIIIFMVVLPQHSAGLPVVVPQPAPADAQPIPNDQDIIVNVNKDRSIAIKPATHRHLAFAGASPHDLCRPAEQKPAQELYEKVPAAGERWRIASKSKQLDLFADRTSTGKMWSNQLRLYFSSIVYVLLQTLRRTALPGTELEKAQCGTIRLKLLKIGAQIRVTVRKAWRKDWVSLSEGYPNATLFARVLSKSQGRLYIAVVHSHRRMPTAPGECKVESGHPKCVHTAFIDAHSPRSARLTAISPAFTPILCRYSLGHTLFSPVHTITPWLCGGSVHERR